jgi:hypothetical protein
MLELEREDQIGAELDSVVVESGLLIGVSNVDRKNTLICTCLQYSKNGLRISLECFRLKFFQIRILLE